MGSVPVQNVHTCGFYMEGNGSALYRVGVVSLVMVIHYGQLKII